MLTTRGEETLQRLEAHFDAWAARLLLSVSEAELTATVASLSRITAAITEDAERIRMEKGVQA